MIRKTDVDTTIDDIHRTRERLAKKFNGDIKAILEDARRRQAASGHPIWHGATEEETTTPPGDQIPQE